MSMFVANLAYSSNMSVDLAKISVLIASGIAAIIGVTSLYFNTKDSSEEDIRIED